MPTANTLNVLVYGATGTQAGPIIRHLLERGHHPRLLTRNPSKAAVFEAIGATVIQGDMADVNQLNRASAGMDAVALLVPFFANPNDALRYGRNAIDAAVNNRVPLLVWNSSGFIPPTRIGNPSIDLRIDILNHLRASGINRIVLQPTVYLENLLGPYTAPSVAQRDILTYPNPAGMRCGWIAADDVGALVVAAIERPELANTSIQISGIANLNGPELAQEFTAALGRPIAYEALPPKKFGAILDTIFGQGAGDAAANEYQKLWDDPKQWPILHADMPAVLTKLPVRMHSVREWVAQHRGAFSVS